MSKGAIAHDTLEAEVRLKSMGFELAVANAGLCDRHAMLSGIDAVNSADYNKAERRGTGQLRELGANFLVVNVVEHSEVAQSELRPGDVVVAVGDQSMSDFLVDQIDESADHRRGEAFVKLLKEKLSLGQVQLKVDRDGRPLVVQLAGSIGCDFTFVVQLSGKSSAWSDGKAVAVTSRLIEVMKDQDELAFVVAHEMAHNILHHADEFGSRASFGEKLGFGVASRRKTEFEADALALRLMKAANYRVDASFKALDALSRVNPFYIPTTHPSFGARKEALREVITALSTSRKIENPLEYCVDMSISMPECMASQLSLRQSAK